MASLVFEGVGVAGRIIDLQRGATMEELFAPQLRAQVFECRQFKVQLTILFFVLSGAHRLFLRALVQSFEFIPAHEFPRPSAGWAPLAEHFARVSGEVLVIGVQLAAPVMLMLLLALPFYRERYLFYFRECAGAAEALVRGLTAGGAG